MIDFRNWLWKLFVFSNKFVSKKLSESAINEYKFQLCIKFLINNRNKTNGNSSCRWTLKIVWFKRSIDHVRFVHRTHLKKCWFTCTYDNIRQWKLACCRLNLTNYATLAHYWVCIVIIYSYKAKISSSRILKSTYIYAPNQSERKVRMFHLTVFQFIVVTRRAWC